MASILNIAISTELSVLIEIAVLDNAEKSKVRAAYNSLFRSIFGYRNFESVTDLQLHLARPTWEMLTESRVNNFHSRISIGPAVSPIHLFSVL